MRIETKLKRLQENQKIDRTVIAFALIVICILIIVMCFYLAWKFQKIDERLNQLYLLTADLQEFGISLQQNTTLEGSTFFRISKFGNWSSMNYSYEDDCRLFTGEKYYIDKQTKEILNKDGKIICGLSQSGRKE